MLHSVGIFIEGFIVSIELPQGFWKQVYLAVIRMKHLLDTWDVIRMLAEGIHIVFEIFLHIIFGKRIVSLGDECQQLLIEVLIAW